MALLAPLPLRLLRPRVTLILREELRRSPRGYPLAVKPPMPVSGCGSLAATAAAATSFLTEVEGALLGFIVGKRKATEVAHSVWKNVVRKGDVVVDATCGNGYDTLALLGMVSDDSGNGFVYGMDVQKSALESTSSLLDESVNQNQRKLVKLFCLCHSKMEEIIPKAVPIRLVAFNLGYLPGGDKGIITASGTTLSALQAACRVLESGGLISIVAYVGHPGGREEYKAVLSFSSALPADSWTCCKLETLNRPAAPVLILLSKR